MNRFSTIIQNTALAVALVILAPVIVVCMVAVGIAELARETMTLIELGAERRWLTRFNEEKD